MYYCLIFIRCYYKSSYLKKLFSNFATFYLHRNCVSIKKDRPSSGLNRGNWHYVFIPKSFILNLHFSQLGHRNCTYPQKGITITGLSLVLWRHPLSFNYAQYSLVNFQTAYKMTSQPKVLAWMIDKKNLNLYYYVLMNKTWL